uniref:Ankyrin repeat domain-containing protein SOWAHB-like n=1 Tax=Saccoglossus kowalevskii TaxID=10224 RepID=A0ABM0MK61_SACKO|nr:PREDICTED: ankyrin repeat domain-containing protein SOWAHB-like [Saccoglossus kowalevskii]
MAEDEFSEAGIRDFLVQNGGKTKNEHLVKRFKIYFNDADNKAKFKEYVNAVASVKTEDGEKYLVLKKKYRHLIESAPVEVDSCEAEEAQTQIVKIEIKDEVDGGDVEVDASKEKTLHSSESKSRVFDVAKSFEKKAEEEKASAEAAKVVSPSTQKKDDDGDDDSVTSTLSNVALSETERQWMIAASAGETPTLSKLLIKEPHLAKQKFTALHWAAKHGKKEMLKLFADRPDLDINVKSHGGYTPLHIASMYGNEAAIQMLLSDFKANVDARDYSGKKPKQHMKKNCANYIQRKLDPSIPSIGVESSLDTGGFEDDKLHTGTSFSRAFSFRLSSFGRDSFRKSKKGRSESTS